MEAVNAYKTGNFDLVLMDVQMLEMDGLEVLAEIRHLEDERGITGLTGVKIVMTTALDDPRSIMKAFKKQCEDYLIKPIDRSKLLEKIRGLGLIT